MSGRGSRFVEITRTDLEGWLDNAKVLGYPLGWERVSGYQGVYLVHLSQFVSIRLTSTIGRNEKGKGLGKASTSMVLVSRIHPSMVLNRKAKDKKYLQRSKGWKNTWLDSLNHWKGIHAKSSEFYDNIARIKDRDQYRQDFIALINSIPNWVGKSYLVKYHENLTNGKILFPKQEDLIKKIIDDQKSRPTRSPKPSISMDVDLLRTIYVKAREQGEQLAMDRIKELGLLITQGGMPTRKDINDYNSLKSYFRV